MKRKVRRILLASLLSLISTFGISQIIVKGEIISEDYQNPVPGANIYSQTDPTKGTITNDRGEFSFSVKSKSDKIVISAIGFEKMVLDLSVKLAEIVEFGQIKLKPQPIDLNEVSIISSIATDRKTPVSVSTIRNMPQR